MIRVKLREAMERYRLRTGRRITYATLAKMSGVGQGTLGSIGSRLGRNVTLGTVEAIARALEVPYPELLEQIDDPPAVPAGSKTKRKTVKKKPRSRKTD